MENNDNHQSPTALARWILRESQFGSLATQGEGGYPYASLVGVAPMPDGSPILLLSNLAKHTANIRRDRKVSLLLAQKTQGDPLAAARLTVMGKIEEQEKDAVRARYLARHPEAKKYSEFADFGFWRVAVESGHLVATFGKIVSLKGEELLGLGTINWPKQG
jgi:putative heme iron utilization protein